MPTASNNKYKKQTTRLNQPRTNSPTDSPEEAKERAGLPGP
jgi:hypothetical protein